MKPSWPIDRQHPVITFDYWKLHSRTLKYTRSWFCDINLGSFMKDFLVFKMQQWPWPAMSKLMKTGGFQKCKVHSSSLKGLRVTACQSWCNLHKWPLLDAGISYCYCLRPCSSSNSKCPRQAVVTCVSCTNFDKL